MAKRKHTPRDYAQARLAVAAVRETMSATDLALDRPDARSPTTDFARQVAIYLCHTVFGHSFTRIGMVFARDRSTASHACSVIEDERADPVFAETLHRLETALRLLSGDDT